MSSISFNDKVKIACIERKTTIPALVEEMNRDGLAGKYNFVHQVLKKQRQNDEIIAWFRARLDLNDAEY